MNTPTEIRALAWQRAKEAAVLCESGLFDGAFYLAGYSVELALKEKICQNFGVPNLFQSGNQQSIDGIHEIRKAVQTHNLKSLLIYSGLKVKFDDAKANFKSLAIINSLIFNAWSEDVRYQPCGHTKDEDVKKLVSLLPEILEWIKNN